MAKRAKVSSRKDNFPSLDKLAAQEGFDSNAVYVFPDDPHDAQFRFQWNNTDLLFLWRWWCCLDHRSNDPNSLNEYEREVYRPDPNAYESLQKYSVEYGYIINKMDEFLGYVDSAYESWTNAVTEQEKSDCECNFRNAIRSLESKVVAGMKHIAEAEYNAPVPALSVNVQDDATSHMAELSNVLTGFKTLEENGSKVSGILFHVTGTPMEYPPRKEYHDNDGRNKYFLEKHNITPYNDHGNRADYDGMIRYHHTLSDNKNSYDQWIKYAGQAGNCIDQWATEFGIPKEVIGQDEPYLRWVFTLYDLAWRNPPGYSCKAKITSGSFIDTVLREFDGEPFVFDSDISDLVEYSIRAVDYLTRGYLQQQQPKPAAEEQAGSNEKVIKRKKKRGLKKDNSPEMKAKRKKDKENFEKWTAGKQNGIYSTFYDMEEETGMNAKEIKLSVYRHKKNVKNRRN